MLVKQPLTDNEQELFRFIKNPLCHYFHTYPKRDEAKEEIYQVCERLREKCWLKIHKSERGHVIYVPLEGG